MLSTPRHGWTNVTIGDWSDRASYLTDVPIDLLEAMILAYRNSSLIVGVRIDSEGWESKIIFNRHDVDILTDKTEPDEWQILNVNLDALASELIADLECEYDAWCAWNEVLISGAAAAHRKRIMDGLLSELRSLIDPAAALPDGEDG